MNNPIRYSKRVVWSARHGAWIATAAEFPGLSGEDRDAAVAVTELDEAIEMALEVMREDGEAPPRPIDGELTYSGQLRLRIPKRLHATCARCALEQDVSINTLLNTLIAEGIGRYSAQQETLLQRQVDAAVAMRPPRGAASSYEGSVAQSGQMVAWPATRSNAEDEYLS